MGKKIVVWVVLVGSPLIILLLVLAVTLGGSRSSKSSEQRQGVDDFDIFLQGLSGPSATRTARQEEPAQLRPAAPRVEPASGDHGREIGEVAAAVKEVGKKVVQEAQARRREHQFMLAVGERNTTRVLAGQSFIQQRLDGIETQTRVQNFFRDQSLGEVRGQVEILLRDLRSAQTPP